MTESIEPTPEERATLREHSDRAIALITALITKERAQAIAITEEAMATDPRGMIYTQASVSMGLVIALAEQGGIEPVEFLRTVAPWIAGLHDL